MRILWFYVLLHTVFAQKDFGSAYLKNSKLCSQWTCVNTKLGLPDSLPPREQYGNLLKSLLPAGAWQDVVDKVLDVCYGDRPRPYTNTCPGQAMMHCAVEHFVKYCPEESLRKDDACAPVMTLAGFKYMFSQSRYENLEKNLPVERRPSWFLKNYFSSKCCNLPQLFNATLLSDCGFSTVMHYYTHTPRHGTASISYKNQVTTPRTGDNGLKIVDISLIQATPRIERGPLKVVDINSDIQDVQHTDPLECCDMSSLIQPSWRSDCDFHLNWQEKQRLVIKNSTQITTTTTTTAKPIAFHDVKVVPLSCDLENCVFKKLNIVSEAGTVDIDAFSKLLDNMTNMHTAWTKAKARVVTKCLTRSVGEYTGDCEINKVLACTFDVLSENCPHATKPDPCKRNKASKLGTTCQISSSKYRPKHRRQFCGIPNLANHEVLSECGMNSESHIEYVAEPVSSAPRKYSWYTGYKCKETTPTTKCLLNKMGVLNKYGFLDYFKMKDRIRQLYMDPAWASLTDIYLNSFMTMSLYGDHCSSPKKLLNVVDAMLTTCPMSKRKKSLACNKIFSDMVKNVPTYLNRTQNATNKFPQVWRQYQHVFLPKNHREMPFSRVTLPITSTTPRPHIDHPLNFVLDSQTAPKVRTMRIKPQVISKQPLVLLPVYLRKNGKGTGSLSIRPYTDGVLRSDPFELYSKEPNYDAREGVMN